MARYTDTRSLVRRAAESLVDAGQVPSPGLVRALLGTGSMNTIVDELRKWRESSAPPAEVAAPERPPSRSSSSAQEALKTVGLAEVQSLLVSLREVMAEQERTAAALSGRLVARETLDAQLQQSLRDVSGALLEAQTRNARSFAEVAESLEKVCSRFDGVQRYMLLQINEAREHASGWKDKHLASKRDFAVWRDTLQARVLELTERLARAQGALGQSGGKQAASSAAPVQAAPRPVPGEFVSGPSPYPGHPRAASGWAEASE
jgi:uncharacterized coiled-coil protein SlyX